MKRTDLKLLLQYSTVSQATTDMQHLKYLMQPMMLRGGVGGGCVRIVMVSDILALLPAACLLSAIYCEFFYLLLYYFKNFWFIKKMYFLNEHDLKFFYHGKFKQRSWKLFRKHISTHSVWFYKMLLDGTQASKQYVFGIFNFFYQIKKMRNDDCVVK